MAGSYKWQGSFAAGVLGPALMGRVDIAKYQVGLKTGKNIFIHAHGGFSNRAGTTHISEVRASIERARLIPFERDETTSYVLVFNNGYMRLVNKGAQVMSGSVAYEIAQPYTSAQLRDINYAQSVDVMFMAHPAHPPKRLEHAGLTSWSHRNVLINPPIGTVGPISVVAKNTGDGRVYKYAVSAVVDGVEGYPTYSGGTVNANDLRKEGELNTVSWGAVTPAPTEYRIYRERGGVYGYIGFTDGAITTMTDDNIDPDMGRTPRQRDDVFGYDSQAAYPSTVAIAQQRLIWGGPNSNPELIVGSMVGDFENYSRSKIIVPDDRLRIEVGGEKLNRIRGMADLQQLIIFTGSGEYGIGNQDGVLDATQPRAQKYGSSGSNGARPLNVGESILYVDRSGKQIRDLRYTFESNGYSGSDLSIFIPHYLTNRTVVDWAYCHSPFGVVWVVLDNGAVLSFTYKREQEVWAWTEHDFGGTVDSVCSVYEDGVDVLYLVVRRVIGGTARRFVERLSNRMIGESVMDACFLDCATVYKGAATTTVTGLARFNGQRVTVVADGDVFPNVLVTGGSITLEDPASEIHVGLPYTSIAETLPLYVELQGTGSSRGLQVRATDVFVQMEKTRGIYLKTDHTGGEMERADMVQTIGDLALKIRMHTGIERFELSPDYTNNGTITVVQEHPLPMTILGISPKWNIER